MSKRKMAAGGPKEIGVCTVDARDQVTIEFSLSAQRVSQNIQRF
jgi:hypothetical protein